MNFNIFFLFIVFNLILSNSSLANKNDSLLPVWIDTDNGFGKIGKDVDDALAIISCLSSDVIDIKGISTARYVNHAYKITKKILKGYNKNIPVYKGAKSYKEIETLTEANKALTKELQKQKTTIIVIGPITNIASVLKKNPNLADSIKQIVFCGGRYKDSILRVKKNLRILRDGNFDYDPLSFIEVLKFNIPIVLSGYDASSSIFISKTDLKPLNEVQNKQFKWMFASFKRWIFLWKLSMNINQFMPFDAVTSAYLVSNKHCNCKQMGLEINWREKDTKGGYFKGKSKYYLEVTDLSSNRKRVIFCNKINTNFKKTLLNQLFKKE